MRVKTDLAGYRKYITDEKSTSNVLISDAHNYYMIGREIKDGDRLSVSVNEAGEVSKIRTYVQAQMIVMFHGTLKSSLTVKGFV
jgi:hypothetical protein